MPNRGVWRKPNSERLRRAQKLDAEIRSTVKKAQDLWVGLIPHVTEFYHDKLYQEFGFSSFSEYCQALGYSDSHLYSLVSIGEQPPAVRAAMEQIGISKAKLALPRVKGQPIDRRLEIVQQIGALDWRAAAEQSSREREEQRNQQQEERLFATECPHCHRSLLADRPVNLRVPKGKV